MTRPAEGGGLYYTIGEIEQGNAVTGQVDRTARLLSEPGALCFIYRSR